MLEERNDAVEIALLRKDLEALQSDMSEVKGDLKKLANAWATAETLVAFVKWLAGLAAAIALLTGMFKGWFLPKE
jgi:hypothetical protein|tara:strand:+ start:202 stop:426 length:225 start_codon:yes stop_codon:yes gene_type:complete